MIFIDKLLLLDSVLAQQVKLLAESRQEMVQFPKSTAEQRLQVASDLMSVYVHREQKIAIYKSDYPNIDPVPRVQRLVEKAPTMTEKDLHYNFSEIFNSLRDRHTRYFIPAPHSCYQFKNAIAFQIIDSPDPMNPTVIVSAKAGNSQIIQGTPDISKVKYGDKLIGINGVSFAEHVKQTAFKFSGDSYSSVMRQSLRALSIQNGGFYPAPERDQQVFDLQDKNGTKYSVTAPWFTLKNEKCETNPKTENKVSESKSLVKRQMKSESLEFYETKDAAIYWGIYDPLGKKMGVVVLQSFQTQLPVNESLPIIKDLISNQLKDTKALVFDLRGNGGGSLELSEAIPALFSKDVKIPLYRAINNDLNRQMFEMGAGGESWTRALEGQTGTYSKLLSRDGQSKANEPIYKKPIGLYVNGECYSACDMMTAIMQDSKIAKIYGEDPVTGGGGANFARYRLFQLALPNRFPELDMKVSFNIAWRQALRTGTSAQKLIEDYGVQVDMLVRPNAQDVRYGDSGSQWQRIAEDLIK